MSVCWIAEKKSEVYIGPLTEKEELEVTNILSRHGNKYVKYGQIFSYPRIEIWSYDDFVVNASNL